MNRPVSKILTERELQIMDVLWQRKSASAEQIRIALPDELHDSSVRTLLRVLEDKGYVKSDLNSKPRVYRATVSQKTAQRKATKNLLQRFFGGSAESLMLRLLEDEQLTIEQVNELRKSLRNARKDVDDVE